MRARNLLFALLLSSSVSRAVSFDCEKASMAVEISICNDPLLGKLDDALSENYKAMLASNIGDGARRDLRETQKTWIFNRNQCRNIECLTEFYRRRLEEICEYPVISGVHPVCIYPDDIK